MPTFDRPPGYSSSKPVRHYTQPDVTPEMVDAVEYQMLQDRLRALSELTGERELSRLKGSWGGLSNITRDDLQLSEESERLARMSHEEALRLLAERDALVAKESMKEILGRAAGIVPVLGPVEAEAPVYGPVQAAVSPSWLKY